MARTAVTVAKRARMDVVFILRVGWETDWCWLVLRAGIEGMVVVDEDGGES